MKRSVLYLVGPTCCGKSTIADILCSKYGFGYVRTTTTREPRPGDTQDKFSFVSPREFKFLETDHQLLESAEYSSNKYGTSVGSMQIALSDNMIAVKIIEVEGLLSILKSGWHEATDIGYNVVYVHPTFKDYKKLLKSSRTDWSVRSKRDVELKCLLDVAVSSSCGVFNITEVCNGDSGAEIATAEVVMSLFKDVSTCSYLISSMLGLPDIVSLSDNKMKSTFTLGVKDYNAPRLYHAVYIHSSTYFNVMRYLVDQFPQLISYSSEDYVLLHFPDSELCINITS